MVGLGRLAVQQILPAFGASKLCRVTALVTGDRDKGNAVAGQYGVNPKNVLDHHHYDRLKELSDVDGHARASERGSRVDPLRWRKVSG